MDPKVFKQLTQRKPRKLQRPECPYCGIKCISTTTLSVHLKKDHQ